jgi:hypothetical protein
MKTTPRRRFFELPTQLTHVLQFSVPLRRRLTWEVGEALEWSKSGEKNWGACVAWCVKSQQCAFSPIVGFPFFRRNHLHQSLVCFLTSNFALKGCDRSEWQVWTFKWFQRKATEGANYQQCLEDLLHAPN